MNDFFLFETQIGRLWIRGDQIISIRPTDQTECTLVLAQHVRQYHTFDEYVVKESAEDVIQRLANGVYRRITSSVQPCENCHTVHSGVCEITRAKMMREQKPTDKPEIHSPDCSALKPGSQHEACDCSWAKSFKPAHPDPAIRAMEEAITRVAAGACPCCHTFHNDNEACPQPHQI